LFLRKIHRPFVPGREEMKSFFSKSLALFLAFCLVLTPGMPPLALAQEDQDSAPQEEIQALQKLARAGYLGDKKDFYLSAKSLAEEDVTDALVKIDDYMMALDLKDLKPGGP